jgi:4-diphosphocytidyl-2-C-methyl-D-erythritol kinase
VRRVAATAKLNLALVVGPSDPRNDKHELVTVFQRIDLADRIELREEPGLYVDGYADDTLVRGALAALAAAAGVEPRWRVRIDKRIPVAGGLGGGSSDAAAALRLANETLAEPLSPAALHELAAPLGADVPFFLTDGPQLGTGDGSQLEPLDLPQDYFVLLLLPHGAEKQSTGAVYAAFDERDGAAGFDERRAALLGALAEVRRPRDLAALPANDLAGSPLAHELRELGAFRADISGAGPTLYGLFHHRRDAEAARAALAPRGRLWITVPCWYG